MRVIWDSDQPLPARVVHQRVARRHKVRPLTVVTVLNNLVRKGLLSRRKRDAVLHYESRLSENEFMHVVSRSVVEGVLGLSPSHVASSFVDVLAVRDPEELEELARLIRRKLKERGKP